MSPRFASTMTGTSGLARFLFDIVGADAITVHPYLGAEAAEAFLD